MLTFAIYEAWALSISESKELKALPIKQEEAIQENGPKVEGEDNKEKSFTNINMMQASTISVLPGTREGAREVIGAIEISPASVIEDTNMEETLSEFE